MDKTRVETLSGAALMPEHLLPPAEPQSEFAEEFRFSIRKQYGF